MAIRLYNAGAGKSKEDIIKILSIPLKTVNRYLTDIDKQIKEARKQQVFEMFLACNTQEEIADVTNTPRQTITEELKNFAENGQLSDSGKESDGSKNSNTYPASLIINNKEVKFDRPSL